MLPDGLGPFYEAQISLRFKALTIHHVSEKEPSKSFRDTGLSTESAKRILSRILISDLPRLFVQKMACSNLPLQIVASDFGGVPLV